MQAKEYLLIVFQEEAIEVAHGVSKVLRFTANHSFKEGGPTNLEDLNKEYNEMLAMVELLAAEGVCLQRDESIIARKKERVEHYLKHSMSLGVVHACTD